MAGGGAPVRDSKIEVADWPTIVSRGERSMAQTDLRVFGLAATIPPGSVFLRTNQRQATGTWADDTYARFRFATFGANHTLSAGFNYSDSQTRVDGTTADGSFAIVPNLFVRPQPVTELPGFGPINLYNYTSSARQYGYYAQPAPQKQLDANLYYRIGKVSLNAGVANLLDDTLYGVATTQTYVPPRPPRTFRLTLGYSALLTATRVPDDIAPAFPPAHPWVGRGGRWPRTRHALWILGRYFRSKDAWIASPLLILALGWQFVTVYVALANNAFLKRMFDAIGARGRPADRPGADRGGRGDGEFFRDSLAIRWRQWLTTDYTGGGWPETAVTTSSAAG